MGPLALIFLGFLCIVAGAVWYFVVAERPSSSSQEVNFVLLPPSHSYSLDWDPPQNMQMITKPKLDEGEKHPGGSRLPCFRLKNIGRSVAENLSVQWQARFSSPLEKFILASTRLQKFSPSIENGLLTLRVRSGTTENSWGASYNEIAVSQIPYLAPTLDNEKYTLICTPSDLWTSFEYFIAATLPMPTGAATSAELTITVQWSEPQRGEQKFRVIVKAINSKPSGTGKIMMDYGGEWREPPELMTFLSFAVSKLG